MATKVALWERLENARRNDGSLPERLAAAVESSLMGTSRFYGMNSMATLRTKSVSTKVTEEEYAKFEALAGERTISEWARDVLSRAANPKTCEQTILAEVLALRTALLNLFFKVASAERITADEMQQLIERADADKLKKALSRIQETEKLLIQGGTK